MNISWKVNSYPVFFENILKVTRLPNDEFTWNSTLVAKKTYLSRRFHNNWTSLAKNLFIAVIWRNFYLFYTFSIIQSAFSRKKTLTSFRPFCLAVFIFTQKISQTMVSFLLYFVTLQCFHEIFELLEQASLSERNIFQRISSLCCLFLFVVVAQL